MVTLRDKKRRLGQEERVLVGSANEGPESSIQLICPGHVIKMDACFDKDILGHYFPTELISVWLFKEASRKNDTSPENIKNDENVVLGSVLVPIKF